MEEGRLTDSFGRHVDFKNTVVIMTSNVGSDAIKSQGGVGFAKSDADITHDRMKEELMKEVERQFRPEFLNRVDEIIFFRTLTREDLTQIIDIETRGLAKRLQEKSIQLILTPEAKEHIINEGYNPEYGARPLRRAIQRILEDPLAEEVLRGHFHEGTKVLVEMKEGFVHFQASQEEVVPEPEPEEAPVEAAADKPDADKADE
jgi:ATP-dependent Clp protease ATP-binding subunit ClpC